MQTVNSAWEEWSRMVMHPEVSPSQLREMKAAFFGGYAAAILNLERWAASFPLQLQDENQKLLDEIVAFVKELKANMGG